MKKLAVATLLLMVLTVPLAAQPCTVYDIIALPNPLRTYTYFTAITVPSQYELDWIRVRIYNLSGQEVASRYEEDTWRVYWDGDNLANGVYLYKSECCEFYQGQEYRWKFGPYTITISK